MKPSDSLIFILNSVYLSAAVQSNVYYKDFSHAEILLFHYYRCKYEKITLSAQYLAANFAATDSGKFYTFFAHHQLQAN